MNTPKKNPTTVVSKCWKNNSQKYMDNDSRKDFIRKLKPLLKQIEQLQEQAYSIYKQLSMYSLIEKCQMMKPV